MHLIVPNRMQVMITIFLLYLYFVNKISLFFVLAMLIVFVREHRIVLTLSVNDVVAVWSILSGYCILSARGLYEI